MHPSTLSAGNLVRGMYVHVLCHEPNSPLSRIWVHLSRLEESWAHLLCRIRASGPFLCPGQELGKKKDVTHGRRTSDSRRQFVGDEQIGTASKADKAEV